jgi:hypothetical protein
MDKKNVGMIATVATVLLCGLPGLCMACFGVGFAVVSFIPNADIDMFGSTDPQSALTWGIAGLCVGIIFILIPVLVAFFTLRKKPGQGVSFPQEPIPPAS